jgi:hypothetical protein
MQFNDVVAAAAVFSSAVAVGYKPNDIFYPYPRPRKKAPATPKQDAARRATKRQKQARKKNRNK